MWCPTVLISWLCVFGGRGRRTQTRVMLHVFPVMLQETRATLQETGATLYETRATLQETSATLQEIRPRRFSPPLFTSYLRGRVQYVRCGLTKSAPKLVLYGVPQGSVLGAILFLLYTADLIQLIERHDLSPHLYADVTQVYGSCRPSTTAQLLDVGMPG